MYSFDSRVRYSEASGDGKLGLCAAIHYMQDCSIFQSEMLGVGIGNLRETKRAWLLSSWQVEFVRRPDLGEKIKIGTWANGFKAMYGYRNFVIRDMAEADIIRANSIWIYMNLETGRPEKVDEEIMEIYHPEPALMMETQERKIKIPDELKEYPAFPVQRYQIDTNGHVNNGQYIEMASEWLPEDRKIRKLRVEYKKAAVYGDVIFPWARTESGITTVVLKAADETVYAVVQVSV